MTHAQRDLVGNKRRQKYLNSCPASVCDMLLNLADKFCPLPTSHSKSVRPDNGVNCKVTMDTARR